MNPSKPHRRTVVFLAASCATLAVSIHPAGAQDSVAQVQVQVGPPPDDVDAAMWGGGEPDAQLLHGFRLGYVWFGANEEELAEMKLRTPHSFLIGYELAYRMVGHGPLNVLLLANAMVAGLEQSVFLPSGNLLIGFELDRSLQIGVGLNLTPDRDEHSHMIVAVGWTPWAGGFHVPVHFFFVPDVDGRHRSGATIGVTW